MLKKILPQIDSLWVLITICFTYAISNFVYAILIKIHKNLINEYTVFFSFITFLLTTTCIIVITFIKRQFLKANLTEPSFINRKSLFLSLILIIALEIFACYDILFSNYILENSEILRTYNTLQIFRTAIFICSIFLALIIFYINSKKKLNDRSSFLFTTFTSLISSASIGLLFYSFRTQILILFGQPYLLGKKEFALIILGTIFLSSGFIISTWLINRVKSRFILLPISYISCQIIINLIAGNNIHNLILCYFISTLFFFIINFFTGLREVTIDNRIQAGSIIKFIKESFFDPNDSRNTGFITGMRGYAAIAIFFIHLEGLGMREFSAFSARLLDFCRYGVVVFFVISSFTIALSLSKKFNLKDYSYKRIFRIYPIYLIVILITFLGGGVGFNIVSGMNYTIRNLISHAFFLNTLDLRFRNNILGTEWTISVEVFYYIVLPLLVYILVKRKFLLLISIPLSLVFSLLPILILPYTPYHPYLEYWAVERYLFSYILGICLFVVMDKIKKVKFSSILAILLILTIPLFIIINTGNIVSYNNIFVSVWTFLFIYLGISGSKVITILCNNRVANFLGKLSYSFYLIHYPVILFFMGRGIRDLKLLIIAFPIVLLLSILSFIFIEKPLINYGKKLLS